MMLLTVEAELSTLLEMMLLTVEAELSTLLEMMLLTVEAELSTLSGMMQAGVISFMLRINIMGLLPDTKKCL